MSSIQKLGTSRQLRPTLLRLKNFADGGFSPTDSPRFFAQSLDIRPQAPCHKINSTVFFWRNVRFGRIEAAFDGVWHRQTNALFFSRSRIATTHEVALDMLVDIYGAALINWSPSCQGWWTVYATTAARPCRMSLLFNAPRKHEKQTLFFGAIITPEAG